MRNSVFRARPRETQIITKETGSWLLAVRGRGEGKGGLHMIVEKKPMVYFPWMSSSAWEVVSGREVDGERKTYVHPE